MLAVLRFALQAVLFFLLLALVLGVAAPQTGPLEKLTLLAVGAVLVVVAVRVRRLGRPASHS